MKWILAYQTPYNNVKYITDSLQTYSVLSYKKFIELLGSLCILDLAKLVDTIDHFQTVYIDVEHHCWELYRAEKEDVTFDQLLDLNIRRREQKEKKSSLDQAKGYIKSFLDRKYNRKDTNDKRDQNNRSYR